MGKYYPKKTIFRIKLSKLPWDGNSPFAYYQQLINGLLLITWKAADFSKWQKGLHSYKLCKGAKTELVIAMASAVASSMLKFLKDDSTRSILRKDFSRSVYKDLIRGSREKELKYTELYYDRLTAYKIKIPPPKTNKQNLKKSKKVFQHMFDNIFELKTGCKFDAKENLKLRVKLTDAYFDVLIQATKFIIKM